MKYIRNIFILSAVFLVIIAGIGVNLNRPAGLKKPVLFHIRSGESTTSIAYRLQKRGIIRSAKFFKLIALITGEDRKIGRGVYEITPDMTTIDVFNLLTSGKTHSIAITIPEGYNIFDIAKKLKDKGVITNESDFIDICTNGTLAKKHHIPARTVEGYLFPDTYFIPLGYSAKQIANLMIRNFWQRIGNKAKEYLKNDSRSLHEVITMASLVEKETGVAREKPIVASVYYNRLKKRMLLQCDPTLIYALMLEGRYDGNLSRRRGDFDINSPYNTYKYKGLPPSPIANAGIDSILASIFPAKTDYLYFVAKGDGTHHFSRTAREHREAVFKYQILPLRKKRLERLKKSRQR